MPRLNIIALLMALASAQHSLYRAVLSIVWVALMRAHGISTAVNHSTLTLTTKYAIVYLNTQSILQAYLFWAASLLLSRMGTEKLSQIYAKL
jgi:hypothetical protein